MKGVVLREGKAIINLFHQFKQISLMTRNDCRNHMNTNMLTPMTTYTTIR